MQTRITSGFKKDYERVKRQGLDVEKLATALRLPASGRDALPR